MSSSETESEGEQDGVERKSVLEAFRGYRTTSLVSLLSELVFCRMMWNYKESSERQSDVKQVAGQVHDNDHIAEFYWVVFCICLVARLVILMMWRCSALRCRDSRYGAFYMFFSSIQWVYYLYGYYRLQEEMTGITWVPNVAVGPNRTMSGDNFTIDLMKECLEINGTEECRNEVNQDVVCKEEYNKTLCSGWIQVGDTLTGFQKCCVKNTYSLQRSRKHLPHLGMTCTTAFSILQWLAVLAMKWVYDYNPMLAGKVGDFVNGATIDILDSVIFAAYLLDDRVLYRKVGIQYFGSKGTPCPADDTLYRRLMWTWVVAIVTAVLSPVIFTFFRAVDADTPSSVRTYQDAIGDLTESTRMLQAHTSYELVDEAIRLQLEQYVSDAGGRDAERVVKVIPETEMDDEDSPAFVRGTRSLGLNLGGMRHGAARHSYGTTYRVKYSDGGLPVEEEVDVSRLVPDNAESSQICGPGCFRGWCQGQQSAHDRFQARAEVCDAFRSLFCLELPFMLWRIYFELSTLAIDSWTVIVIAKNVAWGLHNLLVILSCNNPTATICGFTPLQTMSMMIKGSAMSSVYVGPVGVFRIVADMAAVTFRDRVQGARQSMEVHLAWLIIEKEALAQASPQDKDALASFDTCIERVKMELSSLDMKAVLIHT